MTYSSTGSLRLEEQVAIALPRERTRDPRVSVVEIPDGNTNAALHFHARLDGVVIVDYLLRLRRCRWREIEADIQLSDGGIHAKFRKRLLGLNLSL